MKSLILFTLIFSFATAMASDSSTPTFSAVQFFKPLDGKDPNVNTNERDPSWPERLNFEGLKVNGSFDLHNDDIKKQLEGTWLARMMCQGAPPAYFLLSNEPTKDNKELTRDDIISIVFNIEDMTYETSHILKRDSKVIKKVQNQSAFVLTNHGKGLFSPFSPDKERAYRFLKIKETNEMTFTYWDPAGACTHIYIRKDAKF